MGGSPTSNVLTLLMLTSCSQNLTYIIFLMGFSPATIFYNGQGPSLNSIRVATVAKNYLYSIAQTKYENENSEHIIMHNHQRLWLVLY